MTTPFRQYIAIEDDQPILSAMADLWRKRLNAASSNVAQRRARAERAAAQLSEAEALEREARDRLEAIAERREALHRAAEAPDREALAASPVDVPLDPDPDTIPLGHDTEHDSTHPYRSMSNE